MTTVPVQEPPLTRSDLRDELDRTLKHCATKADGRQPEGLDRRSVAGGRAQRGWYRRGHRGGFSGGLGRGARGSWGEFGAASGFEVSRVGCAEDPHPRIASGAGSSPLPRVEGRRAAHVQRGSCFFSVGAGGGSHPHPALSLKGEGKKGAPVARMHRGVGAVGCRLPGGPLTEFGGYAESASPLGEGEAGSWLEGRGPL